MSQHTYIECDREGCDQRYQANGIFNDPKWWRTGNRDSPDGLGYDFCSIMCAALWEKANPPDPAELAGKVFRAAQGAL